MLRRRQLFVCCFMSIAASTLCFAFLCMLYRPKVMRNVDVITIVEKAINRYFGDRGVLSSSNKKTSDILVIGYLRGGTTFIGEILGLRNDSFYVYEPLHKMAEFGYFKPGHECSMYNETCRKSNKTDRQLLNVIRAIYNCDYSHYKNELRTWQHLKSRGIESLNDPKWNISFPECNGTWKNCQEKYQGQCSNRGSVVSKAPRLSVNLAAKLLDTLSNLKIIHLLRDPRAIMNSRTKLKWTPVPGGALSLCHKMTDDYHESEKVKNKYPGRLHTVFYEDVVTDQIETFRKIYNFAGYDFSAKEQLRLAHRTASSKTATASNTYRTNSTRTAHAWRNNINRTVLNETNKACFNLYGVLGYPQLGKPGDVSNSNIPLRMKPYQKRKL